MRRMASSSTIEKISEKNLIENEIIPKPEPPTFPSKSEDFETLTKLGQGGFGTVYKVVLKATREEFALKKIVLETYSGAKQAMLEINLLEKCSHPNIVNYFRFFVDSDQENAINLCMLMEFAPQGDLQKRIKQQKQEGIFFTEKKILNWFRQICSAVDYIHQRYIIHRDLKPQNILLFREDYVKLADFGIARTLDSTGDLARTLVGTLFYMAPEVYNGEEYSASADIWSLGVLLIAMATLQRPYLEIKSYLRGEYVPLPSNYIHIPILLDLTVILNPNMRVNIEALYLEVQDILTEKDNKHCCSLL